MGLASWEGKGEKDSQHWYFVDSNNSKKGFMATGRPTSNKGNLQKLTFMEGNPYLQEEEEGGFKVNWKQLNSLPFSGTSFSEAASIAASVQSDLEASALALVKTLKEASGATRIAFAGISFTPLPFFLLFQTIFFSTFYNLNIFCYV